MDAIGLGNWMNIGCWQLEESIAGLVGLGQFYLANLMVEPIPVTPV